MDKIVFDNLPIGKIRFLGKEGMPVWSTLFYMEQFCLNHLKLMTIQRICEVLAKGADDSQLSVVAYSLDLFPEEPIDKIVFKEEDLIVKAAKDNNAARFWYIIQRYKRPVVLFQDRDSKQRIPLYDYTHIEAAKIWSFKEQSPPDGIIRGAVGAAIDLFYAGEREERDRLAYLNQQIGKSADNWENIARASQIINSDATPAGVRYYANEQIRILMEKQAELNKKMGLTICSVDIES